jgi:hypothetical protein
MLWLQGESGLLGMPSTPSTPARISGARLSVCLFLRLSSKSQRQENVIEAAMPAASWLMSWTQESRDEAQILQQKLLSMNKNSWSKSMMWSHGFDFDQSNHLCPLRRQIHLCRGLAPCTRLSSVGTCLSSIWSCSPHRARARVCQNGPTVPLAPLPWCVILSDAVRHLFCHTMSVCRNAFRRRSNSSISKASSSKGLQNIA